MTRILLHPHLLPRTGGLTRVALSPPWGWWRLKLRPGPDGNLMHHSYDHPTNITEYSLMFDLLEDVEIHDPPAMRLTTYAPEYDYPIDDPYRPMRRMLSGGGDGEVDVVWYRRPGPRWMSLPGNTCRPGDYEMSVSERRERQNDDATMSYYERDMPTLRWDQVATDDASVEGRRIAAAFGLPGVIADRTPRTMDEHCSDIYDAIRSYESQMARRPSAVLMNEQDYRELRRLATQDEMARGLFEFGELRQRSYDSIMGLEIRPARAVASGQYVVVDETRGYDPLNPATTGQRGYSLESLASLRNGFAAGIMTPNEIREREGLRGYMEAASPLATAILPESEVVDEIDRLVNDSIRPGPRDDYNANRYDKCSECNHDWHGLECETSRCDCINTDWLATS